MDGVRLSKEELIATYGVSQRLAVRLGALLAKGLEVTGTVLEMAGPGSAIEKLLLHPDTLARADALDTAQAQTLAVATGAAAEGGFIVADSPRGRVLALEEERLAEAAWPASPEPTALARLEGGLAPAPVIDRREARGLFHAEEIARLKLEALAGRDADARTSALRKLVFAPLSPQEKGGVFLRALLDPSTRVRSEAIKSLESLGFNRDMADAIQGLFVGEARQRPAALRRIGDLIGKRHAAERQIVLAVLVEVLRESTLAGPQDPLLQLFVEIAPVLAEHPETAPELARVGVRHLLADPRRLGPPLRDLLARLAASAPAPVLARLWEESATVTDPPARVLLLELLLDLERDAARLPELCDRVVEELLREGQEEVARQKLGHHFIALGLPAGEALLRRFPGATAVERAVLVPFLDMLAVDVGLPAAEVNRAAEQVLQALKTADRRLRAEVLRTRLFLRPEVDRRLREALVRALLPMLRVQESPETPERAAGLLEDLGELAAEGLFEAVRAHPDGPAADRAVRALGAILAQAGAASPLAVKLAPAVFQFLCRRVALPGNACGGYAVALGRMAAAAGISPEYTQSALDLLLKRLGRVRYHGELVEAIGVVAACPAVPADRRVKATQVLFDLIARPNREEDVRMRVTVGPKGKSYAVTGRIEFDSETLPAAVLGLEAIARSPAASAALRRQIAGRLLRVWADVAQWSVVWGPRASEALARALGRIGAADGVDAELLARITGALAAAVERLSVVQALRGLFAVPSDSVEVNRQMLAAAGKLLEHWIQPEIMREELELVLTTLATAAARAGLPARRRETRDLRQRTVELLYDALRSGYPWARAPLERLRDSAALSKRRRQEIAEHLAGNSTGN